MTDNLTPTDLDEPTRPPEQPEQVEVRRNVALAAGLGGGAGLLTVAFAARAFTGGTGLDWMIFAVLAVVTVVHLASLGDSRAPLLVADAQGVRLRQGALWRGIAWPDIDCLEHLPRRGLLRDGHLLVDGYDDQQLVVPLTLATRVVGASGVSLSDVLADLADGRADVVEVVPGFDEDGPVRTQASVPTLSDLYRDEETVVLPGERRGIAARVAAGLSGAAPGSREVDEREDDVDPAAEGLVLPAEEDFGHPDQADLDRLRSRLAKIRESAGDTGSIERVTADLDALGEDYAWSDQQGDDTESTDEILLGAAAHEAGDAEATDELAAVPDEHDEHDEEPPAPGRPTILSARVERDATERERPDDPPALTSAAPHESETVVLDDLAVQPAADPVVGPELAAARERLRLSIDQVSERTRIRPHVIEAIEVDDFGPCGGDFYARGHLRTLARVLGIDAAPLLASYDERYAHEPVDPRRVFESELATGTGGAIRSTRGGRNWSVMIAAVMGAVLIWSIARLVMDGPAPVADAPVLNQSGGISSATTAEGDPVKLTLTAAGGGATLNVRDAAGKIVFEGNLAFGQTTELRAVAPIRIYSTDGSVTYALGSARATALGETGVEVNKTLVARKAR